MNYYCYIATYTLLMLVLIKNSTISDVDKNIKYTELKGIAISNANNFRNLFGNHIQ